MVDYAHVDDLLSPEERAARDRVRAFVEATVQPIIGDYYERGDFPHHLIAPLAELGLLAEGSEGAVADGLVAQELERGDAALRSLVSVHVHLAQSAIRFFGTPEQQRRYLPAMARGDTIGAFALTEPQHGSDPGAMETEAIAVADGYVLRGHKRWATNGTMAGLLVIWARCQGDICAFVVEPGTPGLEVRPIERKLSFRASVSSEVLLHECRLPAEALLPDARGLGTALRCLNEARYSIIWGAVGSAEACFEAALTYAGQRQQFGRPVAGFQLTQAKLADMYSALVQMKLLALHLGRLKDQGRLHHSHVSLGKRANVRAALEIARTARTILGAAGITADYPVMRHAANLETVLTYEGTEEVHTLSIGRALTGLDAFR